MPPERNNPRPSMEGIRQDPQPRQPDYRPEHELEAPPRQELIREHEPETNITATTPQASDSQLASVEQPHAVNLDKVVPVANGQSKAAPRLDDSKDDEPKSKTSSHKKIWLIVAAVIVIIIFAAIAWAYSWYQSELSPASSDTTKHLRVTIANGSSPSTIAQQLQSAGVIKSELAFTIYTKFSHTENSLKAGTYSLQPSLSTQGIVDKLVSGKQDTFDVTFLPGDTLASDRQKLIAAGYSATTVDTALKQTYDSPLFDTKPANTTLEGYFYGQTNEFDVSATVPDILGRFFDQYNDFIVKNNIAAGFQKQGLTLYQGITLASIVQREMSSNTADMPGVARVFLNRLNAGMTLGSDVTYQYAAKILGVTPDPNLDSPYNTRKYPGLPPGPIATPGDAALLAVANPATSNYLFFLSGDDGTTYYATTDAQHQQNITEHCQKKCSID